MSLTVQQLVEQAMASLGASAIPSSIVANASDANQMRAFILDESRYLRSQKFFPQCKRLYTFTLENNRTLYPLPQDFYCPINNTLWDDTNQWPLWGPLSDQEFRELQVLQYGSAPAYAFRIIGPDGNPETIGGQFEIFPTPVTGSLSTLSFQYISKGLFQPKYWQPSTAYTSGTYVSSSGNVYLCDTNGTSGTTPISGTTANIVDGTTRWDYQIAPYESIVATTDMSIFDDDVMISGIKWRYSQSKNLPVGDYNPNTGIPVLHEKLVANAVARWNGDKTISLTTGNRRRWGAMTTQGGWNL
jgi:hypothetical protein